MKATLKELGQVATNVGWCLGIAWRTVQRPQARRVGFRPAIGTFAYALFHRRQRAAAHNAAILLRRQGFAAQAIGVATATTPRGPISGWAVRVAVLTPLAANAGWADAPPLRQQGDLARRFAAAEVAQEHWAAQSRYQADPHDDATVSLARQEIADAQALEDALERLAVPFRDLLEERRAYRIAAASGRRVRAPQADYVADYRRARTKQEQQQLDRFLRATRPALWESLWYQRTYGRPLRPISDQRLEAWASAEDARLRAVSADDDAIIDVLGPWDGTTDQTADGALARTDHSYARW
jgi:hypothetical protein